LHEGKWRNTKHRAQFLSTLKQYAYPYIGSMGVAEIDTPDVLRVIEPIWPTKTETASRVRQRVEKVLAWAIVLRYRAPPNPAAWMGHLREALPARSQIARVEHHKALSYKDLPAFFAVLRTRPGFAAMALQFTILTATRTGEVIGARWSEVDLQEKSWTIPAERMKANRQHKVSLAAAALAVLSGLLRESDYLFPGGRRGVALSNMAMATLLRRMGEDDITVHGFRSAFSDWAHETTSYPNHIIEMALAHSISNKVEAAYRRGDMFDKRRQLMEDWATYCVSAKVAQP
jgi:integrase